MKKFLTAIFFAVTVLGANVVFSAPISQWGYINDAKFIDYQNESLNGQGGITISNNDRTLSWGSNNISSSSRIVLNAPVSSVYGGLFTDSNEVEVISITHFNEPISSNALALGYGKVNATIDFIPVPDDEDFTEGFFSTALEFYFFETANGNNWNPSPTRGDVFLLLNPGDQTNYFDYDGYRYTYSFSSPGFQQITNAAYISYLNGINRDLYTDLPPLVYDENNQLLTKYFGWITAEDGDTNTVFKLSISAEELPNPVPEPSTVLLLGAGLLGLGAVARRRRAN